MDFQFKDIAAKVVALKDNGNKDQYKAIVRWMVVDKRKLYRRRCPIGEICRNEIEKCDKALANCICKEITDKLLSKVDEILSNRL